MSCPIEERPAQVEEALDERIREIEDLIQVTEVKLRVLRSQQADMMRVRNHLRYPADHILLGLDAEYRGESTDEFEQMFEGDKAATAVAPDGHFGKTEQYMEVARQMAVRGDGRVRVVDVAREVKRRGLSDARHGSITATVHKGMSKSESWRHHSPGIFEHLE